MLTHILTIWKSTHLGWDYIMHFMSLGTLSDRVPNLYFMKTIRRYVIDFTRETVERKWGGAK